MKARYKKYILNFKRPGGTSRGVLTQKETWFLILEDKGTIGIGECGLFRGLSVDDVPDYEQKLDWTCTNIQMGKNALWEALKPYPSIQFGLEQAFISLSSENTFELFASDFTKKESSIPINGLIWMGDVSFMLDQIQEKLSLGFSCLKMKIGAIDFDAEISLLKSIRQKYNKEEIELRVDANGAFSSDKALEKLHVLADFDLHSIEQPIRQGNLAALKNLCEMTPIPIALDEELIGISDVTKKEKLLLTLRPQYIIIKPSLLGGFKGSQEWIDLATKYDIGWWVTSALESNIGLNAIAQWTYTLKNKLPQGLGTGGLFTNNFESPLTVENGRLSCAQSKNWDQHLIQKICT